MPSAKIQGGEPHIRGGESQFQGGGGGKSIGKSPLVPPPSEINPVSAYVCLHAEKYTVDNL